MNNSAINNNDTTWLVAIMITAGIAAIGWGIAKVFEFAVHLRSRIYFTQERLIFFARQIHSPGVMREDLIREADRELRGLASSIRAAADAVLFYRVWSFLKIILPKNDVKKASKLLIRLHNSLGPVTNELTDNIADGNRKDYEEIGKLLKIDLNSSP